jgi:hypothetical protein
MEYRAFNNAREIALFNSLKGGHFFDDDTMKFWNSRVIQIHHNDPILNLFVTSERILPEEPVHYSIRWLAPEGRVHTLLYGLKTESEAWDSIARFFLFGFPF